MKQKWLLTMILSLGGLLFADTVYAGPRFNSLLDTPDWMVYASFARVTGEPLAETAPVVPVFGWRAEMVADTAIARREEGLDIKGVVPELTSESGTVRESVNERLQQAVEARITAAKDIKARSIDFDYYVYDKDSLISVIIRSVVTSAASRAEVASVNFYLADGAPVTMSDAVGVDIAPLAEKLLTEKIRRNPEKYNTAFDGLSEDPPYYVADDHLVLLFNEFQLAQSADGITKLEINLTRLMSITITKADYRVKPGYDLKMVPLRTICNGLGYDTQWIPEEQRVDVYRDGVLLMELTAGANNYLVREKKMRSLEAAPELIEGTVYVPISFFDQILSLTTYSVDSKENIIFLSYTEAD